MKNKRIDLRYPITEPTYETRTLKKTSAEHLFSIKKLDKLFVDTFAPDELNEFAGNENNRIFEYKDCAAKIISYLLVQLSAKNQLSKISHCDAVYNYLLNISDQEFKDLKSIIEQLSIVAEISTNKTPATNAFLIKYPAISLFNEQGHPFYYWLKTLKDHHNSSGELFEAMDKLGKYQALITVQQF